MPFNKFKLNKAKINILGRQYLINFNSTNSKQMIQKKEKINYNIYLTNLTQINAYFSFQKSSQFEHEQFENDLF